MPVLERYQSWLEAAPYPRLIRNVYLLKLAPDAVPEFNRVNIQSGELDPLHYRPNYKTYGIDSDWAACRSLRAIR